ncbi:hypothetical protein HYC85_003645 [Camellia sinensis]|uniref:Uncharacterized protein n=1 Tax=Camellia sinensis TaxID=4442 RepID=A0A7J7HUA1_CAMSI|nr:hypothetical protein HYC85_003645 [Camellia sinensis]
MIGDADLRSAMEKMRLEVFVHLSRCCHRLESGPTMVGGVGDCGVRSAAVREGESEFFIWWSRIGFFHRNGVISIDFTGFGSNVEAQDLWRCVISCGRDGFSDQIRIMPVPALIQFVDRLNGENGRYSRVCTQYLIESKAPTQAIEMFAFVLAQAITQVRVGFRESSSSEMEASGGNSDAYRGSSVISSSNSRRYGMQLSASNFFHSPLSTLLEYSGILRTRSNYLESESSINSNGVSVGYQDHIQNDSSPVANSGGEVSIRIIGAGEQEHDRLLPSSMNAQNEAYVQPIGRTASATSVSSVLDGQGDYRSDRGVGENGSQSLNGDGEAMDGAGSNSKDSSYQRYDI